MHLLLDTHILLSLVEQSFRQFGGPMRDALLSEENTRSVSVASFWEIAIKEATGRLKLVRDAAELPDMCRQLDIEVLEISARDVLTVLAVQPRTRDPFDRLLIAQCQARDLRLLTVDRALADHPLAWR